MSDAINKHSRMPRKLSKRTLRMRESVAFKGPVWLTDVDPKGVLSRYMAGERMSKMAKEYGVSTRALYGHLIKNIPDEWIAAQKAKATAMKEDGEEYILDAKSPLDVAIGREILKAGQWDLERIDRKNYGRDEQNININVIDLGERLRRSRDRIQVGQSNCQVIENGEEEPTTVPAHARAREIEDAELIGSSGQEAV